MTLPTIAVLADEAAKRAIYAPSDAALTALLKTVDFYFRTMWAATRELYNGEIGAFEFESVMIDLIQNQLRRAWNEGLRSLGLDPATDMTMQMEFALQDIMLNELDHVGPFAQDVLAAKAAGKDLEPFRARVQMWTNRYNDVVNQAAQFAAEAGQKMMWVYGDTDHCDTCLRLNGIVAFESEWETAGLYPQRPPNARLECGGWKCQCSMVPTDQRRSPDALTTLLNIGMT